MPSRPRINSKGNYCHSSDHDPLAYKINNLGNSDFYCLALRVGVFTWFYLMRSAPFHLNFVHQKAKPKAAAFCPSASLSAGLIADFYLIDLLTS